MLKVKSAKLPTHQAKDANANANKPNYAQFSLIIPNVIFDQQNRRKEQDVTE